MGGDAVSKGYRQIVLLDGFGLAFEFSGLVFQFIQSSKCGEPLVSFGGFLLHHPAYLGHAFGTGVDRAAISLTKVVCAAHHALIFCAVTHREHMPGLVGGDLHRAAKEGVVRCLVVESEQRPHSDAVL